MTKMLMMTLIQKLGKIAIKKKASHPSSIREPDIDFRKLVDQVEQAEVRGNRGNRKFKTTKRK